ncbi:MAG: SUMF1/EgtB/PvdO family nonheme iron enzyme [Firmicutes bacterium]|nr:SUMF1/EgtB/PvdO family nonheme iron enzyme [Bacillota bacterium]
MTLRPAHHLLLNRWQAARAHTDQLFELVRPEAMTDRPIPERHRIIFYLGHLEAFDWNLVARQVLGLGAMDEEFDTLFAFGIDPVDGSLPTDQPSDWPAREQIETYNRKVRERLDREVVRALASPGAPEYLREGTVLHAAIEHRLLHAETLAYMLHQLPLDRQNRPRAAQPPSVDRLVQHPLPMVPIPAGTATLGRRRAPEHGFGWDNEFEQHTVAVPAFAIDPFNVTNGDYLEFLRAGGYQERSFWMDDDWNWIRRAGISHPTFWVERRGRWYLRTMFDEIPLPLGWPVYVSHAEASAYCRWAGKALPTEAQFHRAAYGTPEGREREYPWGDAPPASTHGNFDFQRWDPVPVGTFPAGHSAFGVADLVGNGWEWTSTRFEPFEGFQSYPFYPGYSANFFDGKHYVLKGGSARTAACLLRRSFRNWFQPHYPYVYATFRGVRNTE